MEKIIIKNIWKILNDLNLFIGLNKFKTGQRSPPEGIT